MNILHRLFGPPIPAIDSAELQAKLKTKPAPLLLDVRQPEEYRAGHIEGAKLIPLGELTGRLAELPKEREIICVCQTIRKEKSAIVP